MSRTVPNAVSRGARRQPSGELALIAALRARTPRFAPHLKLGIGDDCAIVAPPRGHEILLTTDFSLEDRHFRRSPAWHSPQSVGHRTLARGLSDLAAMGAQPLAAFLSLALPRSLPGSWLTRFLDGLLPLAAQHHVPLAGGDTAESPSSHVLADVVLLGSAPAGRALRRSTARAGDLLYVTGSLGGSAAQLANLAAKPHSLRAAKASGGHPHLFPQPRLAVGRALLQRRLATACIDLSDGLSTDLAHLCTESHVAATVQASQLPLHPLTQVLGPAAALHQALHGGEDYELLFTARPDVHVPRSIAGVRIAQIGTIRPQQSRSPQVNLTTPDGRTAELPPLGWQHLR